MSAAELVAFVGQAGTLIVRQSGTSLRVPVEVQDARRAFGRIDLLVTPVGGRGEAWVSLESVELEEATG